RYRSRVRLSGCVGAAGRRLAERVAAVRDEILRGPDASAPAALRAVGGSARFLAQLDAYLDLYGSRPEMWIELTLPLWGEDSAPLFRLIAGYLEDARADPSHHHADMRRAGKGWAPGRK